MTAMELVSHHRAGVLPVRRAELLVQSASAWLALLRPVCEAATLTIVGEFGVDFPGGGASAVILLAESHLAIHAWPEHRAVTVDIHVCDFGQHNAPKADALARLLTRELCADDVVVEWSSSAVAA